MKLSTNEVTLIGFVGGDPQAKETRTTINIRAGVKIDQ